ncbi:MAG: carbamoyltransferase C-terminal domain-containing protein [Vicinamibacterales bacterium]
MIVGGIARAPGREAAALAVDGRIAAAVARPAGPAGESPGTLDACLAAAGRSAGDLTHVVIVDGDAAGTGPTSDDGPPGGAAAGPARHRVSRLAAHWRLARASGAVAAVVADGTAAMLVDDGGARIVEAPAAAVLLALAGELASILGLTPAGRPSGDALGDLEQLAGTHAGAAAPLSGLVDDADPATADRGAFDSAVAAARDAAGAPLDDASSPLVRAARVRAGLAEAFLAAVAAVFGALASRATTPPALAGRAFASPDFAARVRAAAGRPLAVAPWPSADGAAVGAALAIGPSVEGALSHGAAVGPPATEQDAKAVLENCRLDYLYEPRWPRLLDRVSQLLERGKLVAWFQGAEEFGHPLSGSRSILCDPSGRYARDNVNVFLRGCAPSTPIPLVLARGALDCVDRGALSPWGLVRTRVHEDYRDRLRAGLDARGDAHVHALPDEADGPLAELLDLHLRRTGVPGLVNLPLDGAGPGVTTASTPRDAIRATFGSSVDALVLHRFLVMKDYWQMRVDAPPAR